MRIVAIRCGRRQILARCAIVRAARSLPMRHGHDLGEAVNCVVLLSLRLLLGVDCSGVLGSLTTKGLVEEKGRLELPGRPLLYGTTENFLRCFNLESIENLPPLPESDKTDNSDEKSEEEKSKENNNDVENTEVEK